MGKSKSPAWAIVTKGSTIVGVDVDGWRVQATVEGQNGYPVITRVSIEPLDGLPEGGLSARTLHAVRLGELLEQGRRALSKVDPAWLERQQFSDVAGRKSRPGRAGHGVDHYLEVARVYASAEPRRRAVAVAERFGVSTKTATQMISDARNVHGLIPKTAKAGVVAAGLTDKALELLKARNEGNH